MKLFMCENFLLNNKTAEELYHKYAKEMPLIDYHCHISPKEIAENKTYENITDIWLGGDHYKWRAMRALGIDESYITGDKPAKEKFMMWAKTMPYTIGNPLYHWTHLELKRFFGIDKILSPETAEEIWEEANKKLQSGELNVRNLIKMSNVTAICTTDDPVDSLEWHKKIKEDSTFDVSVTPTFRPDKAVNIELDWFVDWMNKLSDVVGKPLKDLNDLENALLERIEYFNKLGCFISDHALDIVVYEEATFEEANAIFKKGLKREPLTELEIKKYKGYMMVFFGRAYAKFGWAMQIHIGALRNNSARMLRELGPDTGFDSVNDATFAVDLSRLLNKLDDTNELPKTILYCLNPRDNELLATMAGNFQGGGIPGKIQFGSGWWFNDQKDGMERQMEALAQLGVLSTFIGMLTDSRSFLSYTRHEYFRRVLCNKLGTLVENGEYPANFEVLGKVVQDICYNNALNYFGLNK
ncbi:D-glucuronate isomerase [Natranaerovirga pectinivora]|uniref:Uronate isomerase n=1 Tax=Natranaerovirga pectinivora TaxID=682400 RepID=A0A4R3MNY5_9FIRM|nr:glucuronate isomerase [Natranaerovirga pectinivora]TCT13829.1 D-glucuronate isomerase [Natranaerovirga pectinivora]